MTARERARALLDGLLCVKRSIHTQDIESDINKIASALADAERGVWEEAAMLLRNDPDNVCNWTENAIKCADEMATYFDDKAQATQEATRHGE